MEPYLALLRDVRQNGERKKTRAILKSTGAPVGALSVFGRQARFPLGGSFPAVTTKRLFFKGVAHELLWFHDRPKWGTPARVGRIYTNS